MNEEHDTSYYGEEMSDEQRADVVELLRLCADAFVTRAIDMAHCHELFAPHISALAHDAWESVTGVHGNAGMRALLEAASRVEERSWP